MYIKTNKTQAPKITICPECSSKSFLFKGASITCRNCGYKISARFNKYGAKKTIAKDGMKRDSKFEASVADDLLMRKRLGDIKDYDSQYKVEMDIYSKDGLKVHTVNHKVDFRIHHNDGSYELLEAKGVETTDYRFRRKLLEKLWLPIHKDHTYTVVKQNSIKSSKNYCI